MNKKERKKVTQFFGGLVLMSLLIPTGVYAYDKWSVMENELLSLDTEEEIISYFQNKDFDELIFEMNLFNDDLTEPALIYPATALLEKAKDISPEKIIREIKNEKNNESVRITLIQINSALGNEAINDELLPLLYNDNTSIDIKRNILLDSSLNEELYEEVAIGEDSELAFHALLQLELVAPEKASAISNAFISNFNGKVTPQLRASIMEKGRSLRNNSTDEDITAFIKLCDEILKSTTKTKNEYSDDSLVADTIIFALSETRSKEGISYIIANEEIDDITKSGSIDENALVLKEMLAGLPSKKDVEIVVKAMNIHPIIEIAPALEDLMKIKKQNPGFETLELSRIETAIQNIVDEGVPLNEKYN